MNKPSWIIIHHSAVSRTKNANQFDAIDRYHKGKGWGQIGYHYLIESDGTLKNGRLENQTGAHCKELFMNYRSVGVCLTGNFDMEEPTEQQKMTLLNLINKLKDKYKIPASNIVPHRHYATYKSCWGRRLPDDILGYLQLPEMSEVSEWAKDAWDKAEHYGVMKGRPKDQVAREELAVILDRLQLFNFFKMKDFRVKMLRQLLEDATAEEVSALAKELSDNAAKRDLPQNPDLKKAVDKDFNQN